MSSITYRLARLEAARAAHSARNQRRQIDPIQRAARIAHLAAVADPLGPATRDNLRACRVLALVRAAQARLANTG